MKPMKMPTSMYDKVHSSLQTPEIDKITNTIIDL
jgi:hypothetical protein